MSAHNFWNNFTHGFMHGVFNNNPFFGCMNWGWSFNSWCNPFNSCFAPFPAMMYTYPVMSPASIFPLMPNISMPPMPNITFNVNELFPTDNWNKQLDNNFLMGDVFEKSSNNAQNNTTSSIPIQNTDYSFSFIGQGANNFNLNMFSSPASQHTTMSLPSPLPSQPSVSTRNSGAAEVPSMSSARTSASSSSLAALKGKHWTEMTDEEMRLVYGDYTRDITKPYQGTAADLNKYLKGKGVLEGQGQAFIDAQKRYGISASALVGIAMNESAGGTSKNARQKNNVGGVRVAGSTTFKTYSSVSECISDMARFLKSGYVNNSGRSLTKLYQINAKYCPTADPTDHDNLNALWARNVNKYASEVESALV